MLAVVLQDGLEGLQSMALYKFAKSKLMSSMLCKSISIMQIEESNASLQPRLTAALQGGVPLLASTCSRYMLTILPCNLACTK